MTFLGIFAYFYAKVYSKSGICFSKKMIWSVKKWDLPQKLWDCFENLGWRKNNDMILVYISLVCLSILRSNSLRRNLIRGKKVKVVNLFGKIYY